MIRRIQAAWQHFTNPVHVYCRLRDLGLGADSSRGICVFYERCLKRLSWRREVAPGGKKACN